MSDAYILQLEDIDNIIQIITYANIGINETVMENTMCYYCLLGTVATFHNEEWTVLFLLGFRSLIKQRHF